MTTTHLPAAPHPQRRQHGAALMVMLVILIMGAVTIFVTSLSSSAIPIARDKVTADALAKAKEALIGYAVSQSITSAGDLRLPDLGYSDPLLSIPAEGSSPPNFTGNIQGLSLIGKFPWKSLGTPPLRDGHGECLWYALSGWFKNTNSSPPNWDTPGQIDVIDGNGNVIASNIAALLVAAGQPLDGQSHSLFDSAYTQCGGNYDAHNYLDSYNSTDAISGQVNYFTGSTNYRIAPNTNNKQFVLANTTHYNDQFLFITTDDIFRPIIRRSDFSAQISALMSDPYFLTAVPSSTNKGIGNICGGLAPANQAFCNNWKEMLLFTTLPAPSSINIDGMPTTACTSVLIFGGQKTAGQIRITAADKSNPVNYLEGANATAFAIPTATSNSFSGSSTFSASNPSADLLVCIP
jgi:hypothetical protein